MAIVTERDYRPIVDEGDPDDYRPNSSIAMVLDPASSEFFKTMRGGLSAAPAAASPKK